MFQPLKHEEKPSCLHTEFELVLAFAVYEAVSTADKLLTLTGEDCPFQRVYKIAIIMTSLHPSCNCIQEGLQ